MKEKKARVEDAMHATKAAVEEGIVPGGGVALLHAARALKKLDPENDDQKVGVDIVRRALEWPVRQIAENAGYDGAVVAWKLLEHVCVGLEASRVSAKGLEASRLSLEGSGSFSTVLDGQFGSSLKVFEAFRSIACVFDMGLESSRAC